MFDWKLLDSKHHWHNCQCIDHGPDPQQGLPFIIFCLVVFVSKKVFFKKKKKMVHWFFCVSLWWWSTRLMLVCLEGCGLGGPFHPFTADEVESLTCRCSLINVKVSSDKSHSISVAPITIFTCPRRGKKLFCVQKSTI